MQYTWDGPVFPSRSAVKMACSKCKCTTGTAADQGIILGASPVEIPHWWYCAACGNRQHFRIVLQTKGATFRTR